MESLPYYLQVILFALAWSIQNIVSIAVGYALTLTPHSSHLACCTRKPRDWQ